MQENLRHAAEFVIKNNVNITNLVGVGLQDFVEGRGVFDIAKFATSEELKKFLPGSLTTDKEVIDYMGFLIGIFKGKISPNLTVRGEAKFIFASFFNLQKK